MTRAGKRPSTLSARQVLAASRARRRPKPKPVAGTCRVCGCTDNNACQPMGCWWVDDTHTLCSECAPTPKEKAA